MPYTHAELSAGLLALHAADQPILLGENLFADHGTGAASSSEWSAAGDLAGADDTNTSFPVRYGYDRRLDIVTKHVTSSTDHWLLYDMGVGAAQEIEFDSLVLSGHNLKGKDVTVTVVLTDDGDFTGTGLNVVVIATFVLTAAAGTSARIVSTTLDHVAASSRLYSDVRYVGLHFVYTSGATITEVGQLWLAKRLQLEHQFKYPHPFKQRRTKRKAFRTDDDHVTNVILADKAEVLPAVKTQVTDTTVQATLIDDVKAFLDAVSWGGKPFHYIEQPTTLDQLAPLMNFKSDPKYLEIEAGVQALQIDAVEEAPLGVSET